MLSLATVAWTLYMYVSSSTNMRHNVPPPMIIESGQNYEYNEVESALYIPSNWTASCYNQEQLAYYMVKHFNAFRNGNNRMKPNTMDDIARKWVCIVDTEGEK